MTTFSQLFGTATAFTITLTSLADGSSADSSSVDNSTASAFEADFEIQLDGASASNTGFVEVYLLRSIDDTDYPDSGNDELVGVIQMNGTTAVKHIIRVTNLPKYYKLRLTNNSGAALNSSGNSAAYQHVNFTDA